MAETEQICISSSPSPELLATMPAGSPDAPREYLHGDYLMLCAAVDASPKAEAKVCLLTIWHHRQLSFDFVRLWPSAP